jgi:hypothetical protein
VDFIGAPAQAGQGNNRNDKRYSFLLHRFSMSAFPAADDARAARDGLRQANRLAETAIA